MQSESKILVEIIVFENKHALSCYNNGAPKSFFPQTTCKKHWIFSMTNNNQEQTTPQNNTQPEESIGSKQNKFWQDLEMTCIEFATAATHTGNAFDLT